MVAKTAATTHPEPRNCVIRRPARNSMFTVLSDELGRMEDE